MNKPIVLASDHGGFPLKDIVEGHLISKGYNVEYIGNQDESPIDHPVIAKRAAERVLFHGTDGIILCGTGIGVSIVANKYKGIRAAVVHSEAYAQLSRQHNHANVLCLGGRFLDGDMAKRIIDVFLETQYLGDRYKKRVDMYER